MQAGWKRANWWAVFGRLDLRESWIAVLALVAIVVHLLLRWKPDLLAVNPNWPLWAALAVGGLPLVVDLLGKLFARQFGSDLLAGISIVTSVCLQEYLAGTLVVLMLSGGAALENYAVRSASSVLQALANRMPSLAHRKVNGAIDDVQLDALQVGDIVVVFPHEVCPIDGTVVEGHGVMDESYLTGEPYRMSKTPGATVLSGAVNGDSALTVRADCLAVDSRYAKIMQVMQTTQQHRPRIRRLGDRLGAIYTPIAIALGLLAWAISGQAVRFLAVMVIATPCPLLIAIPVAIIGSISLAARRAIIIRDPAVLEQVDKCQTMIFDKTGTLTYGQPRLTQQAVSDTMDSRDVLGLVSSLEQYSKHPLAEALVSAGKEAGVTRLEVSQISERPGEGLSGVVAGRQVQVTSRQKILVAHPQWQEQLPPPQGGLECVVLVDGRYAATYQFRDTPRTEGKLFVSHLGRRHGIRRVVLLSGDRESEVQYLAEVVGIDDYYAQQSPEQKLEFVQRESRLGDTIFVGDGINDAPALTAATVGIAFGQNSDVTTEAADAVIMDSSLAKVDEFLHIGRRMRRIALQSAVGGMALSVVGMIFAAGGYLNPVAGALIQEVIDVIAVMNALRVAWPPGSLIDFN